MSTDYRSPSPTTTTAVGSGTWADGNGNNAANAGETISCTYQIGNAGTQTLGELCLVDANVGNGCFDCELAADAVISPGGDEISCSTTYEVRTCCVSCPPGETTL